MRRDDLMPIHELRRRVTGHAYLESLVVDGASTLLTLRHSTGQQVDVEVPIRPSPSLAANLDPATVLAVHIKLRSDVECVALMSADSEQRRRPITLAHAMALAQHGVHTVVMTESANRRHISPARPQSSASPA